MALSTLKLTSPFILGLITLLKNSKVLLNTVFINKVLPWKEEFLKDTTLLNMDSLKSTSAVNLHSSKDIVALKICLVAIRDLKIHF